MNIIKIIQKVFFFSIIFILIFVNVLSVTNAKFHDLLSRVLLQVPITDLMAQSTSKKIQTITAENKRLRNQNEQFKQKNHLRKARTIKAHKISKKVILRTVKNVSLNVSLNVSSVIAEGVPYLGMGIILAVTASDVYAGCETIKDTNEILRLFEGKGFKAEETQVCGMEVPTGQQVKERIREFKDVLGGTIDEILKEDPLEHPKRTYN